MHNTHDALLMGKGYRVLLRDRSSAGRGSAVCNQFYAGNVMPQLQQRGFILSMTKREWSLSALATEFGLDRATVAGRLKHVPPVAVKRVGDRADKKWLLKDAALRLQAKKDPSLKGADSQVLTPQIRCDQALLKDFTFECLLPGLVEAENFRGLLTSYVRDELKLSKRETVKVYRIAAGGLCCTLGDFWHQPSGVVPNGSTLDTLSGKTEAELDAWIAEY
jgi:hypothetical protein